MILLFTAPKMYYWTTNRSEHLLLEKVSIAINWS